MPTYYSNTTWIQRRHPPSYRFTILFHIPQAMHIMYYLLTKEEMQMAFGGVDRDDCCRRERIRFEGIAFVVVIILLLIAMGIVF